MVYRWNILGASFYASAILDAGDSGGRPITLHIRLLDEPKIQYNKQIIQYRRLQITLPSQPDFHYGDNLLVHGNVEV